MLFKAYNRSGKEWTPRGCSCISRRSASSPKAREGDPAARGSFAIFHTNLMAEGGRIELRRVSPRLTAYKAVSAPNGLRLPYQKPMLFEGIGKAGDPAGSRTQVSASAKGVPDHSATGSLVCNNSKLRTGRSHARFGCLPLGFRGARREAKSLQSVIGRVDYSTIFKSDFRAEYSPIGRLGSTWLCHFDLAWWAQRPQG
jgi:hypothetical protein